MIDTKQKYLYKDMSSSSYSGSMVIRNILCNTLMAQERVLFNLGFCRFMKYFILSHTLVTCSLNTVCKIRRFDT